MTSPERRASATNCDGVVWDGAQVTANAPSVLNLGVPSLAINSPAAISGDYRIGPAPGADLSSDVTGQVELVNDGMGNTSDGCQSLIGFAAGNIALMDLADPAECSIVTQLLNVIAANPAAILMADNEAGCPTPNLPVIFNSSLPPGVMITQELGNDIKGQLSAPGVNATVGIDGTRLRGADASGFVQLFAADPVQPGSSISHFDSLAEPSLLMEPSITSGLTDDLDLTSSLMVDIGWTLASAMADLSVEKSDDTDPIVAGNTLTYTVTVENDGPDDALNVEVMDTLPADVTLVSTTGCAEDPSAVPTCSLGTIGGGGSNMYTITVTVDEATVGAITNSVSVTSNAQDPNPANDTASEDTLVDREPPASVPLVADPQNVETDGTNELVITLTGSDSNDEDLTFAIVSGPSLGSLGTVTQVPPSSATVSYTAGQAGDLTDSFMFRVTNESDGIDNAVVSINLPDDTPAPPALTNVVNAQDATAHATTGSTLVILLTALADIADPTDPLEVGDFVITITSGPTLGTLSNLAPADPPPPVNQPNPPLTQNVTSATVDYLSNSSGTDSFDFQACADLNDDGDTLDAGECDTGTISITVDAFTPPAAPVAPAPVDQAIVAEIGSSIVIDLLGAIGDGSVENQDNVGTPGNPGGSHAALSLAEVAVGEANLVIQGFSAPECAALGETIGGQISVTLTNNGGTAIAPATSVLIGFYVSLDSTITTSDTLLIGGQENLSPDGLGIGVTITDFLAGIASINTASPTGSVFIGVLADEFDNVTESDETDNTGAQAITIEAVACPAAPDLIIQSLTRSTPAAPRKSLS